MKTNKEATMKVKSIFFQLLTWAVAITFVSGCSSHSSHLVKADDLFIETIPSSRAYLSDIIAIQEGDELLISGKVIRSNPSFSGVGHVDIAVVSPGGLVIEAGNVSYSPRILPKTPGARKHRASRFEARFSCIPPKWSVIRLAYHAKVIPDNPMLYHEDKNIALPKNHDFGHVG
jgi:hypothetical protein